MWSSIANAWPLNISMPYRLIPNELPVLHDQVVLLRAMSEEDLPAWFARLTDSESAKLAGDPIAQSMQTCIDGLEHHRNAFINKEGMRWSIVLRNTDQAIGSIGLVKFDPETRSCAMGAAINREYWNLGITTRAAALVARYGFEQLGLERIEADTLTTNIKAMRVLEKLGFARQREIADYRCIDGEQQSGYQYQLFRQRFRVED